MIKFSWLCKKNLDAWAYFQKSTLDIWMLFMYDSSVRVLLVALLVSSLLVLLLSLRFRYFLSCAVV